MSEDWYARYRRQAEAMPFTEALAGRDARYFRNGGRHITYWGGSSLGSEAWKYGKEWSEGAVEAALDAGYVEKFDILGPLGFGTDWHIRLTPAGRAAIDGPTMGEHG